MAQVSQLSVQISSDQRQQLLLQGFSLIPHMSCRQSGLLLVYLRSSVAFRVYRCSKVIMECLAIRVIPLLLNTIYIGPAMGIVSSGLPPILLTTLRGRSYYLHLSEEEIKTQYLMALNQIDFRTSSTFQQFSAADCLRGNQCIQWEIFHSIPPC